MGWMEAFAVLEQCHLVVVWGWGQPLSGPVEASRIDCVWSWSAGLLAIVGTAFHPVTVEVDGLVLICEGCSLQTRASAAGPCGTRSNLAPSSSGTAARPRLQMPLCAHSAVCPQACWLTSPCYLYSLVNQGPEGLM